MVEKYSVATQIVMGGVTGWCAGFLFQKVGKLAATAVGGGFLLLQCYRQHCRDSCLFAVLETEPRTSCVPRKPSPTEL
ncbi:FUN14 domain containing 1, isoform CRA_f [Rattus norvegicus]|nr:FUN14 domain containing 1, isoform CRA_f [Rattus norvegicus]